MIHQLPLSAGKENQVPVAGMVTDQDGYLLDEVVIMVTDEDSGERFEVPVKKGVFSFQGEQGKRYNIHMNNLDWKPKPNSISIPMDDGQISKITLTVETGDELLVDADQTDDLSYGPNSRLSAAEMPLVTSLSGSSDKSSTLIVLNSDGFSRKYYILSEGIPPEVVEVDGKLCLKNQDGSFVISDGSMDEFSNQPLAYLSKLGVHNPEIISLQNIYFDFISVEIRDDSKKELNKAYHILHDNPYLKLVISAHADDRGRESYNAKLSNKRANNVESFLVKLGIEKDRMFTFAFGERNPVIPCQVQKCDENDHGKNRRAELSLRLEKPHAAFEDVVTSEKQNDAEVKIPLTEQQKVNLSYGEILDRYGEKRIDGLAFKISIGAYRYNPNLTFDELHDLGDVQKKLADGINYYSLAEFYDLNAAEKMRKEVIIRGIEDAFIKIYYHDKIIPFSTYLQLVQGNNDR